MSEQRKYSVHEIDQMRKIIEFFGFGNGPYDERERASSVENRLRTYMLNGTTPEELSAALTPRARQAGGCPGLTPPAGNGR